MDKLSEKEKEEVEVNNFYKVVKYLYFNPKEKKDFNNIMMLMKKFVFEIFLLLYKIKFKVKKIYEENFLIRNENWNMK